MATYWSVVDQKENENETTPKVNSTDWAKSPGAENKNGPFDTCVWARVSVRASWSSMSRLRSLLRDASPDTPPTLWMLIGVTRVFSYYLLPSSVNTSSVQSSSHSRIYLFALLQGALISKNYLLGRKQVRKRRKKSHTFIILFAIVLITGKI